MNFPRGLFALIFIALWSTALSSKYIYKDEVINNPKFSEQIESVGADLYEKTGISLRLIALKNLPGNMDMLSYEKKIVKEFNEPTILLIFSELNFEIDIFVSNPNIYNLFEKRQILSPVASVAQALAMGVMFAKSLDDFKELVSNSGGTILPLLGAKAKGDDITGKYSAALYNGYSDIAGQVAENKGVELRQGNGRGRNYVLLVVKMAFYGVILMALVMYIRKKLYNRRKNSGTN